LILNSTSFKQEDYGAEFQFKSLMSEVLCPIINETGHFKYNLYIYFLWDLFSKALSYPSVCLIMINLFKAS